MDKLAMEKAHNEFVSKYEHKPFYDIFPMLIVLLALSVFGIFGNSQIVWSSCRKRSLRSNCNLLIAFAAFSDIFHQFAHFILGYHIFTTHTFISLYKCFLLQMISVYCMNFGAFIVLSIGFDRLLSVVFPLRYQSLNTSIYMPIMLLIPSLFALFMTFQTYQSVLIHANVKVICVIVETNHAEAKESFLTIMMLLNAAIIVVYAAVWIVIKLKNGKIDKRIMKSLSAIVCLTLFGWLAASVIILVGILKGWNEEQIFNAHMYIGSLVNLSISLNWPVYMYFSKEYRLAFREQLQIVGCKSWSKMPTKVESTTHQLHSNTNNN